MNTATGDLYSMMILVTTVVREWTALGLCRLSRSRIEIIIIIIIAFLLQNDTLIRAGYVRPSLLNMDGCERSENTCGSSFS